MHLHKNSSITFNAIPIQIVYNFRFLGKWIFKNWVSDEKTKVLTYTATYSRCLFACLRCRNEWILPNWKLSRYGYIADSSRYHWLQEWQIRRFIWQPELVETLEEIRNERYQILQIVIRGNFEDIRGIKPTYNHWYTFQVAVLSEKCNHQ